MPKQYVKFVEWEYDDFDSDNDDGGTEVRNAVAATWNKDGYTGDTYCLGCGEKIANGVDNSRNRCTRQCRWRVGKRWIRLTGRYATAAVLSSIKQHTQAEKRLL